MKITVTKSDIKFGRARSACDCPIARAVKRDLGEGYFVSIAPEWVNISDDWEFISQINLPEEVTNFIHQFDLGKEVKPFSFEVE